MLAHLVLAVSDPLLQERLQRLVDGPDTLVSVVEPSSWREHRSGVACDVVVVDQATLDASGSHEGAAGDAGLDSGAADLLLVSSVADAAARARMLARGFLAVLSDELTDEALGDAVHALVARRREAVRLRLEAEAAGPAFGGFLSVNAEMQRFLRVARKVSKSTSTVLLLGETGVGKEQLARSIHAHGPRAHAPFVVLNCGAIPEQLLDSVLFGHERGAFTGAIRTHRGHFEMAHRGTVFLDEIGEMPLHLQVKLLRAIQERKIQRIGGEELFPVDVRILAATNRDVEAERAAGRIRSDLYYRLSVVTLEIPPLRERPDDIRMLTEHYFTHFAGQLSTQAKGFSPAAMQAMQAYAWPGNIRELVNVVERAVLLCEGPEVQPLDLPESIAAARQGEPAALATRPFDDALRQLDDDWLSRPLAASRHAWNTAHERAYLAGLLRQTAGRVGETARRAGIDPRSLYTKMRRHGLRKEDFR